MPWYLKPTSWLLIALAAAVMFSGAAFAVQTIRLQKAQLERQKEELAAMSAQLQQYEKNIAAAKKTQAAQQRVAHETARLLAAAREISAACVLGEEDEKILSAYTYYFNSGGLRQADGDSAAAREVLPETGAPHAAGSGWTMKNLAENYLAVIDYALQLEKTVECYETDNK